jgi:hypothetical protein
MHSKRKYTKLILIGVAAVWIGRRLMTDQQFSRDLVHNVIIHPCMMLLPAHLAHELHDRNADWAFSQNRVDELGAEKSIAKEIVEWWVALDKSAIAKARDEP